MQGAETAARISKPLFNNHFRFSLTARRLISLALLLSFFQKICTFTGEVILERQQAG
jgi:hypothetical protein